MVYTGVYSLVIIFGVLLDFYRKFGKRQSQSSNLYLTVVYSVILFIFLQLYQELGGNNKLLEMITSTVGYIVMVVPSLGVFLYSKETFLKKSKELKKEFKYSSIYFAIYTIFIVIYEIIKYTYIQIEDLNVYNYYSRCFIYFFCIIPFALVFFEEIKLKLTRSNVNDRKITLIPLIPIIGLLFDLVFDQYDFIMPSYTCTILIMYLYRHDIILNIDPLTGIYNRRILDNQLYNRIDDKKLIAAYIIDIDHFKKFNDDYGHNIGDLALKDVGEILRKSIRKTDYPIRIGGDEFLIIATIDSEKHMNKIMESINSNLKQYNETSERPISLSIGYDLYYDNEMLEEMIIRIDKKMYAQKEEHHKEFSKTEKSNNVKKIKKDK